VPLWNFDFQFTPRVDDILSGRNYRLTLEVDLDGTSSTDFVTLSSMLFDANADPLDGSWDDGDGLFANPGGGAWSTEDFDYVYSQSWRPGFGFLNGAELTPGDYEIRWSATDDTGNKLAEVVTTARLIPPATTAVTLDAADACLNAGEDQVVVAINLSNPQALISGGQFFMSYDQTKLDFVSADVAAAGFLELFESVDENSGTIDYAVNADFLGGNNGTTTSTTLAFLTFDVLGDFCAEEALVTFRSHVPPTRVTEFGGGDILPYLADLGVVTKDSVAPSLAIPDDLSVNADAGGCDAVLTFTNTIDAPVPVSATQGPGVWYPDRYAPAAFEQAFFDGDNRLLHSISSADSEANRPPSFSSAFYNTQGRKYDVNIPIGQKYSIDLYIPSDWGTEVRRADIWSTTRDSVGDVSGFPILGYTSNDPADATNPNPLTPTPRFRVYTQDTDQDPGTGYTADWVDLGLPVGFSYDRWWTLETELTEWAYIHRLYDDNGAVVLTYTDAITFGSVRTSDLIVQAYNFGESYDVHWDNVSTGPDGPVATDDCSPVTVTFERGDDPLLGLSDPFPQGVTQVTWTATDECGNSVSDVQFVTVNAVNDLAVAVELSGVDPASFDRCITFELSPAGGGPAVVVSEVMTFTGGLASGTIEVPCGDYDCITARDTLHTLRRTDTDDFAIVGPAYVADFTSSGLSDDDSLLGGNFNDDPYIDILDFGVFIGQFGTSVGADTTCATPAPHADASGDGDVSAADFSFISTQFLFASELDCDGAPIMTGDGQGMVSIDAVRVGGPVASITVRELVRRGQGGLARGDLNRDGVLDQSDIAAFFAGARPDHLADVDGDGVVTFADAYTVKAAIIDGDAAGDVNRDGRSDLSDLLFVIERIGIVIAE
jgi:hypothetical protein